jgi:hypothetical protein
MRESRSSGLPALGECLAATDESQGRRRRFLGSVRGGAARAPRMLPLPGRLVGGEVARSGNRAQRSAARGCRRDRRALGCGQGASD